MARKGKNKRQQWRRQQTRNQAKKREEELERRKEATIAAQSKMPGWNRKRATDYINWCEKMSANEKTKILIPQIIQLHDFIDFVRGEGRDMVAKGLEDGTKFKTEAEAKDFLLESREDILKMGDALAGIWANIQFNEKAHNAMEKMKKIPGVDIWQLVQAENQLKRTEEIYIRKLKAEFKLSETFPITDFEKERIADNCDWVTKEELQSLELWDAHLELVAENPKWKREDTVEKYAPYLAERELPKKRYV